VEAWIRDIAEKAKGNIILAIVGNKNDLNDEREVSSEEGQEIAKKHNAKVFIETSAKEGTNIDQLF
jgi:Ras-related protein Rab-6A